MRYMGALDPATFFSGSEPMNPVAKAQALALMPTLTDVQAEDLSDLADATSYGKRQRLQRFGFGAAGGAALGLILGFVAGKKAKR